MRCINILGLVACLAWAAPALAGAEDTPAQQAAPAQSLHQIVQAQQQIRVQIQQGEGQFKTMSASKRRSILDDQAQLLALARDKTGLDQLGPEQRLRFDNLLDKIDTAIANRDDKRMVCEMVRPTGSQLRTRVCKNAAERDETRRGSQEGLSRMNARGTPIKNPVN